MILSSYNYWVQLLDEGCNLNITVKIGSISALQFWDVFHYFEQRLPKLDILWQDG